MMPPPADPLLRLSRLSKNFGIIRAVRNIDLEIYPGDFLAVFGPNGAGKTTLLKMLASLSSPSSGEIQFLSGKGLEARRRVGYVSHQSLLYNELSGLENLIFYARLYRLEDTSQRSRHMLEKMGLQDSGDRLVREYSRGMKQRLTLARALLHEPDLLLLDEPYTGLDQHGSRLLSEVLARLKAEGRTVVLITHNIAEGFQLCTRAIIQHRGELVFQGRREEVDQTRLERIYFEMVEGR